MRLLWIAVVLAIFGCSYGQEDTTVDQVLIDEIFKDTDTTQAPPENRDNSIESSSRPAVEKPSVIPMENHREMPAPQETTCSSCGEITQDASLTTKISNVSLSLNCLLSTLCPLKSFNFLVVFLLPFFGSHAKLVNVFLIICA